MYTDLLVQIKNAQRAKHELVKISYSELDFKVAELLAKNKYVESVAKKGRAPKRYIEIKLNNGVENFKFISTPSRHIYTSYRELKPVKSGYGLGIVSTPKGIMTTGEARKNKVGGEMLLEVW